MSSAAFKRDSTTAALANMFHKQEIPCIVALVGLQSITVLDLF